MHRMAGTAGHVSLVILSFCCRSRMVFLYLAAAAAVMQTPWGCPFLVPPLSQSLGLVPLLTHPSYATAKAYEARGSTASAPYVNILTS